MPVQKEKRSMIIFRKKESNVISEIFWINLPFHHLGRLTWLIVVLTTSLGRLLLHGLSYVVNHMV